MVEPAENRHKIRLSDEEECFLLEEGERLNLSKSEVFRSIVKDALQCRMNNGAPSNSEVDLSEINHRLDRIEKELERISTAVEASNRSSNQAASASLGLLALSSVYIHLSTIFTRALVLPDGEQNEAMGLDNKKWVPKKSPREMETLIETGPLTLSRLWLNVGRRACLHSGNIAAGVQDAFRAAGLDVDAYRYSPETLDAIARSWARNERARVERERKRGKGKKGKDPEKKEGDAE